MAGNYRELAASLVKRLEACRLVAYADTGGVPTIGYGHTGPGITIGERITQQAADTFLDGDLDTAEYRLKGVLKPEALGALKDHQHAALLSFVFNVGAKPSWRIWKAINDGDLAAVPDQLRRFDKGVVHGQLVTIRGLDSRREAEVVFWNTADESAAAAAARPAPGAGVDQAPPSSVTRAMDTPPTPQPAPPLAKTSLTAKLVTTAGGTAAAVATQAQQIHGVIAPYTDKAHVFYVLDTVAVGAVIAAGIVGLYIHAHQAQARKN